MGIRMQKYCFLLTRNSKEDRATPLFSKSWMYKSNLNNLIHANIGQRCSNRTIVHLMTSRQITQYYYVYLYHTIVVLVKIKWNKKNNDIVVEYIYLFLLL